MYFSAQTIAAVAVFGFGVLPASAVPTEDHSIAERSLFGNWWSTPQNLCDKPNYGAVGKPWDHNSKPGAWCGGSKPSNSGQWAQLPLWDGGDSVKCKSIFSRYGLNICFGGNKKVQLPWGCRPPKSRPSKPSKPSAAPSSVAPAPSAYPSVVSSVLADGNVTISTSMVTPSASLPASSAAAPSPSTGSEDPYANPVCAGSAYQVQYLDYKLVAPNGYWMGQTVGSATQDGSYMTYTLANTVDECLKACDNIEGCTFVNTYYDTNDEENYLPKHAPGVLTCAMFSKCVGTEQNDNFGGQDDPNQIYNSNGYCKSGACGV